MKQRTDEKYLDEGKRLEKELISQRNAQRIRIRQKLAEIVNTVPIERCFSTFRRGISYLPNSGIPGLGDYELKVDYKRYEIYFGRDTVKILLGGEEIFDASYGGENPIIKFDFDKAYKEIRRIEEERKRIRIEEANRKTRRKERANKIRLLRKELVSQVNFLEIFDNKKTD